EQRRLTVRGRAERAQMPRLDPVPGEARAGDSDVGVAFREELLAVLDPRLEQSELLEILGELGRDPRAPAQLAEVELVLAAADRERPPAAAVLARGRGQLLPDHPQRQELVALEPQDRLEPLDVLVAEQ